MRPGVGAPGERVPVARLLLDLNQACLLQMKQAGQICVYLRVEISLPDGRAGRCQRLQDRLVLQRAAQLKNRLLRRYGGPRQPRRAVRQAHQTLSLQGGNGTGCSQAAQAIEFNHFQCVRRRGQQLRQNLYLFRAAAKSKETLSNRRRRNQELDPLLALYSNLGRLAVLAE